MKGKRHRKRKSMNSHLLSAVESGSHGNEGVNDKEADSNLFPPSKLMKQFEDRLRGGHFRFLNQKLYCSTGATSLTMFQSDKSLFSEYHRGYQESMKHWTIQPVNVAIKWLRKQKPGLKVADYGCGDAKIMKSSLPHLVSSLDFLPLHPEVIACDMTQSPLGDASHDIAIFSLALMGTNYFESLLDASRVLKVGGTLWIAEVSLNCKVARVWFQVCSRFVDANGCENYQEFVESMEALGFEKTLSKKPSKLFVVLVFTKVEDVKKKGRIHWPLLKPCVYKRR